MRHVLPEERVTFSHRWIFAAHLNSLFERFASRLEQNSVDLAGGPSEISLDTSLWWWGSAAEQEPVFGLITSSACCQNSHTWCKTVALNRSPRLHEATPGLCKCCRSLLEKEAFFWVSHSTGLEGEMQQESVTQCFLGLFFSPSPSVLSIFNVYGFYLSWHRQQPLWRRRYCRFSVRLRLDPDCLMQSTREKCCMWCNTATMTRSGGGHEPVFIPGEQHFTRRSTQ